MGTDDNDTRVTQQVAILADSYSTPRKWSRRERPTDVTRRAVVTPSRSAALTAHDAFPRTRQSRDSRSGTWSSRPPSVISLMPPSSLSTLFHAPSTARLSVFVLATAAATGHHHRGCGTTRMARRSTRNRLSMVRVVLVNNRRARSKALRCG